MNQFLENPCRLFLAARPQGPRGRDLPKGPRGRDLPLGPRGERKDSKTGVMQYMEAALRGPNGNL